MIPKTSIKHICLIEPKTYNGSWGVADTPEQASKLARRALVEKPHKTAFRAVHVPDGHRLVVKEQTNGITWFTVPESTSDLSTEAYP